MSLPADARADAELILSLREFRACLLIPFLPTGALPRTTEKVEDLMRRYEIVRKYPERDRPSLFHPHDADWDDEDAKDVEQEVRRYDNGEIEKGAVGKFQKQRGVG